MTTSKRPSSNLNEVKDEQESNLKTLSLLEMEALQRQNMLQHAEIAAQTKLRVERAQSTFSHLQPLLDEEQINTITDSMAHNINRKLKGTAPLVLTLYPRGAHFSNHLTKKLGELNLILEENYLDLKVKNDQITPLVEPIADLKGRTILIVDTAIKDGKKMQAALDYCKARGARAVFCAALVDMPSARAENLKHLRPSFYGATCPNRPLVGFGFDVDGFFRNEPGLWALPQLQTSSSNTSAILAALETEAQNPRPLVFQEEIPVNQSALAKAQKAEETFAKLDLLYSKQQVEEKIKLTALQMQEALKDSNPVVLSMQKGGSHFTTYLTEHLPGMPLEESYMHITRYGSSQHGGKAKILAEPAIDVKGRTVIISEDLIEGGLTIQMAISLCLERGATAVYVAAMGDKPQKRMPGLDFIKPNFYCYKFDDRFLVGTGLDEQENLRNRFGVWAHKKQQAPAQSKWWEYGKYLAAGAAVLGVGLFAAYKLAKGSTAGIEQALPKLKM